MLFRLKHGFFFAAIFLWLSCILPTLAFGFADAKIKLDDTRWFRIGLGLRSSFAIAEEGAPNGTSTSSGTSLENMRLYTIAKVHENISLRSKIISFIRDEMTKLGFLEKSNFFKTIYGN